ncbi:MAG: hypothetical protein M3525_09155 [Acidobacteriota bacterium]|nr:hypothetical protein [Acidobacteriota bacterium]
MLTKTNELNYKLSDFKIGTTVSLKSGTGFSYGHIIGFNINNDGEAIIKVKWTEGNSISVHPSRLQIEK